MELNNWSLVLHFFRTIPKPLNWLAFSTTMLLAFMVVFLNPCLTNHPIWKDIAQIVEGVLGSIIASYFFFLIVVHWKIASDRRAIYPQITVWAKRVVGDCERLIEQIANASQVPLPLTEISKESLQQALSRIRTGAPVADVMDEYCQPIGWLTWMTSQKQRSRWHITKIMGQLIFLDAELVKLVCAIDGCNYFNQLEFLIKPSAEQHMGFLANLFMKYFDACKELKEYLAKHPDHTPWPYMG